MTTNEAGAVVDRDVDVVVVGGGAAGLAASVALARSRRSVVVLDAGEPRNAPADGVHNYLAREGTPPLELVAQGRAEAEAYGVGFRRVRVSAAERTDAGFVVHADDGSRTRARRLVLATGVVDRLPEVPGLAERWGRDVLHCPYCHGWEVRDRAIGVLVTSPAAAHGAKLFRQLSDDVVVLLHGSARDELVPEAELQRLERRGVRVVPDVVEEVLSEDDRLCGVRLASGEVLGREALVVTPVPDATSPLLAALAPLGVVTAPVEMGGVVLGTAVAADPTGRVAPGVWAAGNVVDPMAQVVASAAAGMRAGAMVNADLVEEETP